MIDIQYFTTTLPHITSRDHIAVQIENAQTGFTVDDIIRAWCEHDSLHYLSGQPFTENGEECVSYLERYFLKGWFPLGKEYNVYSPSPCSTDKITVELINETAQIIKDLIY